VRKLIQTGESAALMLTMMFMGSLVFWVGIPVGALYAGSKVEAATDSLGAAVLAMGLVVVAALFSVIPVLGWLNRKHMELRAARGHQDVGQAALEGVMVVSAGIALLAFVVWFFFLAGASPWPTHGRE
jgi:hypothetical protein